MKKTCVTCSGSGQISYFKGVSRFLISTEECPECCGLGFLIEEEKSGGKKRTKKTGRKDPA